MSDFVSYKLKRSKRTFHCEGNCGGKIVRAGDAYAYYVGKWDGEFGVAGYCLECHAGFEERKKKQSAGTGG